MKSKTITTLLLLLSTLLIAFVTFNSTADAKTWNKTTPKHLRGNWEEYPKSGHAKFFTITKHYIYAGMTQSDVYPYKIIKTQNKGSKFYIKGYMSMGKTHTVFKIQKKSPQKIISLENNGKKTSMYKVKHIIQFW